MANMSMEKMKMPEQAPDVRNKNFSEVALGYEYEMAKSEAERCLQCKNKPCIEGCPVAVQIPEFIKLITEDKLDEAYAVIKETNSLPAICGRVCPQETQCEQLCLRGKKGEPVAIGRLERYLADRVIALEEASRDERAMNGEASCDEKAMNGEASRDERAMNGEASRDERAMNGEASCDERAMNGEASRDERMDADEANQRGRADSGGDGYYHQGDLTCEDEYLCGNEKRKVAIIGSGPASLTCAGDLAKRGYDVTVFEAFHVPGGVLMYGIPEFRLPKKLVQQEISQLRDLGVKIELNAIVGKTVDVRELQEEGYEAVFIGTGAGLPMFMKIPGENLCGVYSANEFLTRINLMKAYRFPETDTPVKRGKNVAVFGGGNVAMDAARCAKRLGAECVYIVYRRSEKEMPARVEEVHHAAEEGIVFKMLTNPTRILDDGKGWVAGIECVRMELGEPDASGRRRPIEVKGSEFVIDVDTVVVAIGQSPNPIIRNSMPELKTQSWGGIIVDEDTGATNLEGVYAGGDAVTGAATVILAMGAGKVSAEAIDKYLKNR